MDTNLPAGVRYQSGGNLQHIQKSAFSPQPCVSMICRLFIQLLSKCNSPEFVSGFINMYKEHICVWKVEGKALLDRRLPSSGLLHDVSWFKTDVSGLPLCHIIQGQTAQEDGTHRWFKNISFKPTYAS